MPPINQRWWLKPFDATHFIFLEWGFFYFPLPFCFDWQTVAIAGWDMCECRHVAHWYRISHWWCRPNIRRVSCVPSCNMRACNRSCYTYLPFVSISLDIWRLHCNGSRDCYSSSWCSRLSINERTQIKKRHEDSVSVTLPYSQRHRFNVIALLINAASMNFVCCKWKKVYENVASSVLRILRWRPL